MLRMRLTEYTARPFTSAVNPAYHDLYYRVDLLVTRHMHPSLKLGVWLSERRCCSPIARAKLRKPLAAAPRSLIGRGGVLKRLGGTSPATSVCKNMADVTLEGWSPIGRNRLTLMPPLPPRLAFGRRLETSSTDTKIEDSLVVGPASRWQLEQPYYGYGIPPNLLQALLKSQFDNAIVNSRISRSTH
jgi:hypothetical protein